MNIEFVSYTGKYPNLCNGILTLKIDNEIVKFGNDCKKDWDYNLKRYKNGNYEKFWISGGSCYFGNYYSEGHVTSKKWELDYLILPDFLKPYSDKLIDVFNDNVPYGCCGGCFERRIELLVSAGVLNSNHTINIMGK